MSLQTRTRIARIIRMVNQGIIDESDAYHLICGAYMIDVLA